MKIKIKRKIKASELGDVFDVQKPFPNEHACRLVEPGKFDEFRRRNSESPGEIPDFIFGIFTEDGERKSELQSRRYPLADNWSVTDARKDCEDNDGILFEPAEPEAETESGKSMKADNFIQRIEFDASKFSSAEVQIWLSEHGFPLDNQVVQSGTVFAVTFDSKDAFDDLEVLDVDINRGVSAFIGERRKSIKSQFVKKQEAKRIVTGVVMEPGVMDTDREFFSQETIERAAHTFLAEFRQMNMEHMKPISGVQIVESFITPISMSLGEQSIKLGSWIMSVKVNDNDLWKQITNGEITGFSIEGFAKPVVEDE